ncbi:DUF4292 domain-containing protein [Mucilaginibacter sp. HMF5004]|uniref:DUF4292 domain-containing protein n=1 Tax=Mucilaginibacter rivuli TaxID=2857527 RepID=UPI001C5EFCCE|nr:DUF4292 domain-containing protein [Mucilaginibacter rivuli]MBW4888688.1 DUF4292 domain-containing protein [Mucilaginibacter rivuli]
MKKNMLNKLCLACCLFALFSCAAKKQLVERKADTALVKTQTITAPVTNGNVIDNFKVDKINTIKLKQTVFNTFSGKAAAKLTIDGKENNVTMVIRIKKGEGIWIAVTAILGVEVARAVITPDSISVMNRLESNYLKKPFSYIYQYTSNQINYKTLESALIGNAIPELLNNDAELKPDNGDLVLSGTLQELVYKLIIGPDLRVTQTNMTNPAAGQAVEIANTQFIQVGTRIVPSQVTLSSTEKERSIKVDLHYTKADFDLPVEFPFSIPARYSPVN